MGAGGEPVDLEANKQVVRDIYERGFNQGDASVFDTLYTRDFRHHSKTIHDVSPGVAGEKESMLRFREAIPDAQRSSASRSQPSRDNRP